MKRILKLAAAAILIVACGLISSCNKDKTAKVQVTVLHETVDLNTEPLTGATVRVYFDEGGSTIDESKESDLQGQAEFEFEHIAILHLDVTYLAQQVTKTSFIRLEEGETVEVEVNIDNP